MLSHPQRAAVAGTAVEMIVDPLGHVEEVRLSTDYEPRSVDPDSAYVSEQNMQHLGDSATCGG